MDEDGLFKYQRYLGDTETIQLTDERSKKLLDKLNRLAKKRKLERVESEDSKICEIRGESVEQVPGDIGDVVADSSHFDVETGSVAAIPERAPAEPDGTCPGLIREVGGYTVIEGMTPAKRTCLAYRGPEWLREPTVVSTNLSNDSVLLDEIDFLDETLKDRLKQNGIHQLFPIQLTVIPWILKWNYGGLISGMGGLQPPDVCVSSPTGSGKTLTYVLPILQVVSKRVVPRIRALVVVPTKVLADQVTKSFHQFQDQRLVTVALTGLFSFEKEQEHLLSTCPDIVVCTPGRLVDHLSESSMDISYIRFLVLDEVDRLLGEGLQNWLHLVETKAARPRFGRLVDMAHVYNPLQKLLLSATVSSNPENLAELDLFKPVLFAAVGDLNRNVAFDVNDFSKPENLLEKTVTCSASEKPQLLLYLLDKFKGKRVLCFANSIEQVNRLHHVIQLSNLAKCRQMSSMVGSSKNERQKTLQLLKRGKITVLICTDTMSRGMDVPVDLVLSYDVPVTYLTYVHRVGRTARAGESGRAITFVTGHCKLAELGKLAAFPVKREGKRWTRIAKTFAGVMEELPAVLLTAKGRGSFGVKLPTKGVKPSEDIKAALKVGTPHQKKKSRSGSAKHRKKSMKRLQVNNGL